MVKGDHVLRTWRDGRPGPNGLLADSAALALGFLAQYQAGFDLSWYDLAERLAGSNPESLRRSGGRAVRHSR